MSATDPPRLSYPCQFPVKAFLRPGDGAEPRVRAAVEAVAGGPVEIRRQLSAQGKFVCLSFDFVARSEEHVTCVRAALQADPAVLMSL